VLFAPAVTVPKSLGYKSLRPTRLESHVSHLPWQSALQSVHKLDSAGFPLLTVPKTSLLLSNLIVNTSDKIIIQGLPFKGKMFKSKKKDASPTMEQTSLS
jgi:hypothetical protein